MKFNNKFKSLLSILCLIAVLFSAFAGCDSENTYETTEIVETTLENQTEEYPEEEDVAEEQQDDRDGGGKGECQRAALLHALVDTVKLAGTHILARVNGHGLAEGEVGHHGETVDPHDDHIAGNHGLAHSIGQSPTGGGACCPSATPSR